MKEFCISRRVLFTPYKDEWNIYLEISILADLNVSCKNFIIRLYDLDRNQKNSNIRKTINCVKNFREINTEAPVITAKRLKVP